MLRAIEKQKEDDMAAAELKKQRNAKMRSEVEISNKVALDRKAEKLQMDREEDLKIVRYNAELIAKEQAE